MIDSTIRFRIREDDYRLHEVVDKIIFGPLTGHVVGRTNSHQTMSRCNTLEAQSEGCTLFSRFRYVLTDTDISSRQLRVLPGF